MRHCLVDKDMFFKLYELRFKGGYPEDLKQAYLLFSEWKEYTPDDEFIHRYVTQCKGGDTVLDTLALAVPANFQYTGSFYVKAV